MREISFSLQLFFVCRGYLIRHVELMFLRGIQSTLIAIFSILLYCWTWGLQTLQVYKNKETIFPRLQQWFRIDMIWSYRSSLLPPKNQI